jgi:hypothetical protein
MTQRDAPSWLRLGFRVGAVLAATVGVCAALGVSRATADSGSVVRGSGDLTGVVLACSTDSVTLSGSYRYTESGSVRQVGNGTWFSHGTLAFNLDGVRGTGTSGVSYRVVGASSVTYAFFFGGTYGGGDVEHSTQTWHLVPSDGGAPLTFQEDFSFIVTPGGSTTLVDHGSGDCS